MILIVGLGNPGEKYKNTRHNLGFMLIDEILNNTFIKQNLNCNGELYKKQNLLILKPLTYMNNSGESVKKVVDFYKPTRIIVCHDELDIPFAKLRIKQGGSSGGHNGLKSIDAFIGNNYERMRLGIGKPENKEDVINFVLHCFTQQENEQLKDFLIFSKQALEYLIENDIQKTQNLFHK